MLRFRLLLISALAWTGFAPLAAGVQAVEADVSLKRHLVGSWRVDPSTQNPIEMFAIAHGFFGTTRYDPDGNGLTIIRIGSLCGQISRAHAFKWQIIGGVLITRDGEKELRDRVLSLTSTHALLLDLTHPNFGKEYRVKADDCGTS